VDEQYEAGRELLHPSELKGYRVAVDAHNLMYVCRAVVRRSLIYSRNVVTQPLDESELDIPWLSEMMRRMLEMMGKGITPVLVMDGPPPPEKEETRSERSEEKKKVQAKLQQEMQRNILRDGVDILQNVRRLMLQLNTLPSYSVDMAIHFFRELGLEVIESNTDGERLCAALCIEGYAAAVLSSDGDTLAHGAPVVIRGWGPESTSGTGTKGWNDHYRIVRLQQLLQQMELCESYFLDFCILCGCDYNKRVRGIGVKRALALVKKHHTIEAILPTLVPRDTSVLKYQRCRELYARVGSLQLMKYPNSRIGQPNLPSQDQIYQILSSYGLNLYCTKWHEIISNLPHARDYRHYRRQLISCGTSTIEVVTPVYDTMNVKVLQISGTISTPPAHDASTTEGEGGMETN